MNLDRRHVLAGLGGLTLIPLATRTARAAPVGSAPFTLLNGKMFVDVTVNGTPAQAFVDSGAEFTGLDQAFAKQAGVKLGLPVIMRDIQGLRRARRAQDVRFEVGGATVVSPAVVTDFSRLAANVQHPIDAVVGGNVFRAYVIEIDFEAQRLSLHDRTAFQPPADARLVPLAAENQQMAVPISIEGQGEIRALLDLGNNVPLIVSPGPARRLGLLKDRAVSTALMGAQGPTTVAQITTVKTVALAGEQFDNVPVLVPQRSVALDANLGLPILQRFRLYLDFGGHRMWLGPPNAARDEPFLKDYSGLNADVVNDTLKVTHLAKGGPAGKAGWRVGDVITAINGDPAIDANRSLALTAHPGQTVQFTMANGDTRTLTLAEYY
jgi:predicted aspartyl protease